MDGDEFTKNPVKILNQIESFLGLPHYFTEDHFDYSGLKGYPCFKLDAASSSECMGDEKARPHPQLNESSLEKLRKHFRPMLDKFRTQTGLDLHLS